MFKFTRFLIALCPRLIRLCLTLQANKILIRIFLPLFSTLEDITTESVKSELIFEKLSMTFFSDFKVYRTLQKLLSGATAMSRMEMALI